MEIYEMTALQVAEKIRNKEITAVDAVESVAKAVEEKDKTYNCYASFDVDSAIEQAKRVQAKIDNGESVCKVSENFLYHQIFRRFFDSQ